MLRMQADQATATNRLLHIVIVMVGLFVMQTPFGVTSDVNSHETRCFLKYLLCVGQD